jgi:phosphoglycolate phosphatase-like HAD superfamily hydrolase
MMALSRYIFCDIDGTLLRAPGAGSSAFGAAFTEVFGVVPDMSKINFSGATDLRVLAQLRRTHQLGYDSTLEKLFFERLPFFLDRKMALDPPVVFPGVGSFLARVSNHWKLGLVTGNIKECALIKLRHAGLDSYFDDGIGGFGDDDGDRNRMAALALERAGNPSTVFLLGDTPSDIEAARTNGMVSVAVCNGQFDRAALEAEGADLVVDSFEVADELFQALEV